MRQATITRKARAAIKNIEKAEVKIVKLENLISRYEEQLADLRAICQHDFVRGPEGNWQRWICRFCKVDIRDLARPRDEVYPPVEVTEES
jgi:hypothetical protein